MNLDGALGNCTWMVMISRHKLGSAITWEGCIWEISSGDVPERGDAFGITVTSREEAFTVMSIITSNFILYYNLFGTICNSYAALPGIIKSPTLK